MSLSAGLYIFSSAEQFASSIDQNRISEISREISDLRNKKSALESTKNQYDKLSLEKSQEPDASRDESNIAGKTRVIVIEIKDIEDRILSYQKILSNPTQTSNDTVFLVSLLSTKIGSAITLLFLVQVLVYLYRYTVRLASFYDSRADILSIMKPDENLTLKNLNELLISENIDFGKQPTLPVKQAIKVLQSVTTKKKVDNDAAR